MHMTATDVDKYKSCQRAKKKIAAVECCKILSILSRKGAISTKSYTFTGVWSCLPHNKHDVGNLEKVYNLVSNCYHI